MGEHRIKGEGKPPTVQWRDLPPIPRPVYEAMVQLHQVSMTVVTDCPKDFSDWARFVVVKGVQTIDHWVSAKLAEQIKDQPTVEIVQPGGLKQEDVLDLIKKLEGKE